MTYLTIPEVLATLRISRATYYRMVLDGTFHPVHVSKRRVLVPQAEVNSILSGNYCPRKNVESAKE